MGLRCKKKEKEKEKERKRGAKEESEEAGEAKEVIKKINGVRDFGVKFGEGFWHNIFWGKSKKNGAWSKFWFFSKIWWNFQNKELNVDALIRCLSKRFLIGSYN